MKEIFDIYHTLQNIINKFYTGTSATTIEIKSKCIRVNSRNKIMTIVKSTNVRYVIVNPNRDHCQREITLTPYRINIAKPQSDPTYKRALKKEELVELQEVLVAWYDRWKRNKMFD